jgi:gamma-glutamyltranspeptidase/glutathione hydrolase
MPHQIIANTAAVAAGHPHGAAAGIEMLHSGGNAVDAAVAAMLALCVVIPGSVGLGGYGGSAVLFVAGSKKEHAAGNRRTKNGGQPLTDNDQQPRVVAVDFDSCAPLGFREGLVTTDLKSSYYGARSVTVPGVVAGLELILREFGTKSWCAALQPAMQLAEDGFEFDTEHQRHFNRCAPNFDSQSLQNLFPGWEVPKVGYRWRQPQLARLLNRLADEGPRSFYDGEIAQAIVRYLNQRGGILTEQDFRCYRPQIVEPLQITCRGFELYTPPLPSGGITSFEILQTVERFFAEDKAEPGSGKYFHGLAEAMKLGWRRRCDTLGDPAFVSIAIDQLLSESAAAASAEQIKSQETLSAPPRSGQEISVPTPDSQLPDPRFESSHTANVIATDTNGNLISITATQGWMYGSHLVVDGMGLVLNHGMSRFDYLPGHPNAPAPGKRMLHNMAPMIALRADRAAFAFGMPGGPKIVSVTTQLALNTIAFGASPTESIAAPRLHTDHTGPVLVSPHMPAKVVAELEKLGHVVHREEDMGGPVNVLAVNSQSAKIDIASGESTGAVAGF